MKICAIICEYNPFHNGHLHQIRVARSLFKDHALLCIMSGNFVQRGEAAIMDKYTRAKHAVQNGADAVIELPTIFATANAELFAKGAIHILSVISEIDTLCFGTETADKNLFLKAAKLLNNEPLDVSLRLKELTSQGLSYAKAYQEAWSSYISPDFLRSPNNILGLEYTKAILAHNATMDIAPIERIGGAYNDDTLRETLSSASAIRNAIRNGESIDGQTPDCVKNNLPKQLENILDTLEKYAILTKPAEHIAKICDCTEGLENAFKKAALEEKSLCETLTSARYTASRIRRIALQNLLGIEETLIRACLNKPLYLRLLCTKKENKELLAIFGNAQAPLISRANDEDKLVGVAKECFERDLFAEQIYSLLYPQANSKTVFIP